MYASSRASFVRGQLPIGVVRGERFTEFSLRLGAAHGVSVNAVVWAAYAAKKGVRGRFVQRVLREGQRPIGVVRLKQEKDISTGAPAGRPLC